MADGYDLPAGWVPVTILAAEASGELIGIVSIRHCLNEHLAEVGGHVGYAVRPQFRRRGHATQMLRQAIGIAADLGLDQVLLTCNDDNLTSARVIERCGGRLTQVLPATPQRETKRHYWISTTTAT